MKLKRIVDVVVSVTVLMGLLPLWIIIAGLVQLSSPGGALFSATVVGKNGRPFRYYKFRTMRADGSDDVHRDFVRAYVTKDKPFTYSGHHSAQTPVFKVINDPRVTPVGSVLRRYSVDEVPQFINVLRGEMSVVGPRPPVLYEYELYDDNKKRRLDVKPGITGLAQVRARGTASFSQMLQYDLEYISNQSFWIDLRIMLETILVMFFRRTHTG